MIRRPPRSTLSSSSAASDVYKRQEYGGSEKGAMQRVVLCLLAAPYTNAAPPPFTGWSKAWSWDTIQAYNFGQNTTGLDSPSSLRDKSDYRVNFVDGFFETKSPGFRNNSEEVLAKEAALLRQADPRALLFVYRQGASALPQFASTNAILQNPEYDQFWFVDDSGAPMVGAWDFRNASAAEYWRERVVLDSVANDSNVQGVFVDDSDAWGCGEGPGAHYSADALQEIFNATVENYRLLAVALNTHGMLPVLSIRNHLSNLTSANWTGGHCAFGEEALHFGMSETNSEESPVGSEPGADLHELHGWRLGGV
eukprot:TRINITY_DN19688_c0_g1_i4.p1 TRINITY_DN19688_c0_g1~~TRINITY_DN19688_c0_g1_i4.p1  ORF type:complete len:310 (+),score=43.96 TRINITY_DN19688_c0_g1_i4:138-1067(+)